MKSVTALICAVLFVLTVGSGWGQNRWSGEDNTTAPISRTGFVGIGTTGAGVPLHVHGNSGAGHVLVVDEEGKSGFIYMGVQNDGGYLDFGHTAFSGNNSRFYGGVLSIFPSGKVGIGTDLLGLDEKLQVDGAGVFMGTGNGNTHGGVYIDRNQILSGGALKIEAPSGLNFYTGTITPALPKVTIDGNGNVGIGTPLPGSLLEIYPRENHDGIFINDDGISGNDTLGVYFGDGGSYYMRHVSDATGTATQIGHSGSSGKRGIYLGSTAAGNTFSPILSVLTSGTNKGNVGIGTTDPSAKLDIKSTGSSGSVLGLTAADGKPLVDFVEMTDGSATLRLFDGNGITKIQLNSGDVSQFFSGGVDIRDRVLIQSTSGDAELRVDVSSASSNEVPLIKLQKQAVNKWGWLGEYPSTGKMSFYSYDLGSDVMVLQNNGNVGIGTTNPEVTGTGTFGNILEISADPNPGLVLRDRGVHGREFVIYSTQSGGGRLDFYDGTASEVRMAIDKTGSVGIGTTSPAATLDVNGSILYKTLAQKSSRALKTNIQDLSTQVAMSTLEGLKTVTFNYKTGGKSAHIGFIAEETPELLTTPDRKAVHMIDIVAVLTKVVQEQQKKIDELEARFNAQQ